MDICENIDIDMKFLEIIDMDIDKGVLQNIDINKMLYCKGFGKLNTPMSTAIRNTTVKFYCSTLTMDIEPIVMTFSSI